MQHKSNPDHDKPNIVYFHVDNLGYGELANRLTNEALAIDQDEITMRKTYATRLNGVTRHESASLCPDRKQDSRSDSL